MSTEKKPEDQITDAGAVQLEEGQLDQASGGSFSFGATTAVKLSPEVKIAPELKFSPELKFDGH